MPLTGALVHIDPDRLNHAIAAAEAAVREGGYPSAVLAAANAERVFLSHVVSHPDRAPASIDMMTRLHTGGLIDGFEQRPAFYGLGWGKPGPDDALLASPQAYEHGGATGTWLLVDPQWDLVFVFLTNCWGIENRAPHLVGNAIYGAMRAEIGD